MINTLSDNCLFVSLFKYREIPELLRKVEKLVQKNPEINVIIDLSTVPILSSIHLSHLLKLRDMVNQNDKKLILCNVPFQIKCELRVLGLQDLFEFAEDKAAAAKVLNLAAISSIQAITF